MNYYEQLQEVINALRKGNYEQIEEFTKILALQYKEFSGDKPIAMDSYLPLTVYMLNETDINKSDLPMAKHLMEHFFEKFPMDERLNSAVNFHSGLTGLLRYKEQLMHEKSCKEDDAQKYIKKEWVDAFNEHHDDMDNYLSGDNAIPLKEEYYTITFNEEETNFVEDFYQTNKKNIEASTEQIKQKIIKTSEIEEIKEIKNAHIEALQTLLGLYNNEMSTPKKQTKTLNLRKNSLYEMINICSNYAEEKCDFSDFQLKMNIHLKQIEKNKPDLFELGFITWIKHLILRITPKQHQPIQEIKQSFSSMITFYDNNPVSSNAEDESIDEEDTKTSDMNKKGI